MGPNIQLISYYFLLVVLFNVILFWFNINKLSPTETVLLVADVRGVFGLGVDGIVASGSSVCREVSVFFFLCCYEKDCCFC